MKKLNNAMLNTLIKLQKQGVRLHLTDDGWKVFLNLMNNEIVSSEIEDGNEDLNVG